MRIASQHVSPEEIEYALNTRSDVNVAVVTEHSRGKRVTDKYFVAYLVPEPESHLSQLSLQQTLQRILPFDMMPSVFIILDSLPLTTDGELDRSALPPPSKEGLPASATVLDFN